jgi:hypothetical protein
MTLSEYEEQGGFHDELREVHRIGLTLTTLEEFVMARAHRLPEREAISKLKASLETVRSEICRTRQEAK